MADPTAQGQTQVTNAANQGKDAINAFDPSNYATTTYGGLKGITNTQDTTQNNYQQAFKDQIANQPTATSLYDTANAKFNVLPLQNTANTLNNTMLTTPNTNLDAAKGFNYDSSQVQQKNTQDLERLAPAAAAATTNANTAASNAKDYVAAGLTQDQMNLLPLQEQGTYLMQQYAAQQTGWTTAQAQQLSALTAKMQSGAQLSAAEMSAYATLSSAEASYQGAVAQANATVNAAQLNNNYKVLSPSQGLYNASTGKMTPYGANTKVPQNGLTY